jgi:hypothetical protein
MKHCVDCKHYDLANGVGFEKCRAPHNKFTENPISGERKQIWPYCETHRALSFPFYIFAKVCGSSGRWFEPKETT